MMIAMMAAKRFPVMNSSLFLLGEL